MRVKHAICEVYMFKLVIVTTTSEVNVHDRLIVNSFVDAFEINNQVDGLTALEAACRGSLGAVPVTSYRYCFNSFTSSDVAVVSFGMTMALLFGSKAPVEAKTQHLTCLSVNRLYICK